MAISTDSSVLFYGNQDTITTTGGQTTDGSVTQASSTNWVNDDDAPFASFLGVFTFSQAATAGTSISLYARLMEIETANDEDDPTQTFFHHYLGAFRLDDASTSAQYRVIGPVPLPNIETSQEYQFYIRNDGGQTLSANWSLYVTPITFGPHAA